MPVSQATRRIPLITKPRKISPTGEGHRLGVLGVRNFLRDWSVSGAAVSAWLTVAFLAALAGSSSAWANVPPVIDGLGTSAPTVAPGGFVTVSVRGQDPDCTTGTCTAGCGAYIRADLTIWSAPAGSLGTPSNGTSASPYTATVDWQAPAAEGTYSISVALSDSGTLLCGGRNSVSGTVDVLVTTSTNRPPVVGTLTASPTQLLPGQSAALLCAASDPDGDPITYAWSADTGTLTANGASATFVGTLPGVATVTCTASDPRGAAGSGTVRVSITDALAESRLTRDLGTPQRIAVDAMGDVYVADPGRGGLAAFNLADGELVYRIPFVGVTSVAVDWQDRLLVGGGSGASLLDRGGLRLLALDPREPLGAVTDVAVDTARRRYAVLYGDTSRILVHDETGTEIGAVGVAGDGPAELRRPQGVAFTPEGDLVVADSGQATIKVIGLDGTLRLSFGGNGTSAGRFVRLDDVEVGADGVIYASDAYQAWVQAFNPDGTLRETIGTYGDGLGRFRTPSGIAAATDYRKLIVASLNTPSLEVFRMRGDPVSARKPQPVLSTTAIGFPATPVGAASAARVVTLGNVGTAPLGLRRVVVNGEIRQTNDCGLALDPGATCSFNLTYVPETPGPATGSLDIETSANPGSLAVALTGEAFLAPTASLVPGQLAFADQRVGTTSAPQSATLSNTGGVPLAIRGISASSGFGVAHGCGGQLPAGAACTIEVSFAPRSVGPVGGALTVDSNAANGPPPATLSGVGLPLSLRAQPETLDFGDRPTRVRGRPRTVTVANAGADPVDISATLLAGADPTQFLIVDDACAGTRLASGASCEVGIVFRPTETGPFTSSLRVVVAGDGLDLTRLTGVGAPPDRRQRIFEDDFESGGLSTWTVLVPLEALVRLGSAAPPWRFNLGWAPVGGRRDVIVRVVNPLAGPADIGSVTLRADPAGPFQVQGDLCSGARVPAGGSCTVGVVFSPRAVGAAAAEIDIASSAGNGLLTITGEGRSVVPRRR